MSSYYNLCVNKHIIQSDYAIVVSIFANYGFYVNQDCTSFKHVIIMPIRNTKTKIILKRIEKFEINFKLLFKLFHHSYFRGTSPLPPSNPQPTRPKTVNITVKEARTAVTPASRRKFNRSPSRKPNRSPSRGTVLLFFPFTVKRTI